MEKNKNSNQPLMTIEDLGKFLQIPISTLRLYTATGEIPSIKIGRHRRYRTEEVERWLKRKSA